MTLVFSAVFVLFFLFFGLTSLAEKEYRAALVSLGLALASAFAWGLLFPWAGLSGAAQGAVILFALVSLIPFFPETSERDLSAVVQYDERDTMFARNQLSRHPELMAAYYKKRPENRSTDEMIHAKPDFGSPDQAYHDPVLAPGYLAAFDYLEKTIPLSNGPVAPEKTAVDPNAFSDALRRLALFYGACDLGITPLRPHHYYSHKGRHPKGWGKKPDQSWSTALTIVVPMQPAMLKQAPSAAVIQESARAYVEAAKISNILAGYVRSFGFRARAHNDANYEILCVPLAVASGMGELGRMGIFMHRVLGPCVRLSVITTDMDLPATKGEQTRHMAQFCRICKKCADNCPSRSISAGKEPESRGFRHWSICQERCFSYWKSIGSDCGLCISVCPFTKPDTLFHRLVRFYIRRNPINQYIALGMDDLLYGRKRSRPLKNPKNLVHP